MFRSAVVLIALMCISFALAAGKQWAFLVVGSKEWINYRHQADLCHAYHLLKKSGVPSENIITMFMDDIAHNPRNPTPGVLINRPNGSNVYEGVVKDYTGKDVSAQNLLNVLSGNKEAMKGIGSGRVIESGPEDTIFVNIIDHGTPGGIFINNEVLYADQLNNAVVSMRKRNTYKKMVFFVDTCESGSMFDSILADNNDVFAMTAAAPDESSYVRYYDDALGTYIGDYFSTIWMEHMEEVQKKKELTTLFKLYTHVRSYVTNSHVMVYGDFRLGFDDVGMFVGDNKDVSSFNTFITEQMNTVSGVVKEKKPAERVPSWDVKMAILKKVLKSTTDPKKKTEIENQIKAIEKGRQSIDSIIDNAIQAIAGDDMKLYVSLSYDKDRITASVFPCYRAVINLFNHFCINTTEHPYATKQFNKFLNICNHNINQNKVKNAFQQVCKGNVKNLLTTKIE